MRKKVCDVCFAILILLFAVPAVLLFVPELFGIRPMVVLSGSMEPAYPVGSVVYVKPCDASCIREGDVISFYLSKDTVVTHRVVAKDEENRCFYTKGDANDQQDEGFVTYEALIGRAAARIPLLGYAVVMIKTAAGKGALLTVAAVVILARILNSNFLRNDEEGRREAQENRTR
ncbi:MAG: signal peptidase I [Fusicatenibacter sp.]